MRKTSEMMPWNWRKKNARQEEKRETSKNSLFSTEQCENGRANTSKDRNRPSSHKASRYLKIKKKILKTSSLRAQKEGE